MNETRKDDTYWREKDMSLFSKDMTVGRTYTDLQKKAKEKVAGYKQEVAVYKDTLDQYEKEFHEKTDELKQIISNLSGLEAQKEDLQFLKEKQEYVLRNFPTLESNIVEKIKGAQANHMQELNRRLDEMERVEKKRNTWNKVLIWISLLFGIAATSGVVVILLYLADVIVF